MTDKRLQSKKDMRENGVLGNLVFKGKYDTKRYFLDINNDKLSKQHGKEKGKYITLNTSHLFCTSEPARKYLTKQLVDIFDFYVKKVEKEKPTIMVVGLGNAFLVADSLGALVVKDLLATHNLPKEFLDELGDLCAIIPGVSGINGFATADIVLGVVKTIKPDIVIVLDALTAKEPARIGCSFQFSNTGISPGAGIGNKNKSINAQTLGTQVIALGVPMMINAFNLGAEYDNFIVTPKEVDIYTKNCAKVIARAINEVVHTKKYKDYL